MFSSSGITELVDLLQRRGVLIHHACQYQDLVSYLKLGGIPSRARLQHEELDTTPFATDQVDQENGVWNKVFVNLQDFGRTFASGHAAVPNPYGPLLLRMAPSVLLEAEDIAICLRSAGGQGFDREKESLKTIEDVDRLFWKPVSEGYGLSQLKFKNALRQEFGPAAVAVEISCTCNEGLLSFVEPLEVIVDPYIIEETPLAIWTQRAIADPNLRVSVKIRKPKVDSDVYDKIASLVMQRTPPLSEFSNLTTDASVLAWSEQIRKRNLEYQFTRFADYLRVGTLEPLASLGQRAQALRTDREYEALDDYFDDAHAEELALLSQEIYEDAEAWERSREDGWYYPD